MPEYGIVIHGGAGAIARFKMTPELEKGYTEGLITSLTTGHKILEAGGSSLDAVQMAVRAMEDNPLFNAGKGAVFTNSEINEMDAAIMDGKSLKAGAVAGVHGIKNPISLARLIMDKLPHVLLARDGAEEFARLNGLEFMPDDYFFTELRWGQLQEIKAREKKQNVDSSKDGQLDDKKCGTVGAVALDRSGNLAAATSTGGMSNSRYGRVGDSPIIGAGTYANNLTCAISATGHGEFLMRSVIAHDVSSMMEYQGLNLSQAAEKAVMVKLTQLGGTGGLVAIDRSGNIALPFNTPGMYRGFYLAGDKPKTGIYKNSPMV
jgi:beta-aspartyl-peptidase (threonine type)